MDLIWTLLSCLWKVISVLDVHFLIRLFASCQISRIEDVYISDQLHGIVMNRTGHVQNCFMVSFSINADWFYINGRTHFVVVCPQWTNSTIVEYVHNNKTLLLFQDSKVISSRTPKKLFPHRYKMSRLSQTSQRVPVVPQCFAAEFSHEGLQARVCRSQSHRLHRYDQRERRSRLPKGQRARTLVTQPSIKCKRVGEYHSQPRALWNLSLLYQRGADSSVKK